MGSNDGGTTPDPTGTQGRARITWRAAPAFLPEDAPSHLTSIGTANDKTEITRKRALRHQAVLSPVHPPRAVGPASIARPCPYRADATFLA